MALRAYTLSPHLVSTLSRDTPCHPHLVPHTLSPHFVGYASSLHFVPTLCRVTGHGGPVLREWSGGAGRGARRFLVLVSSSSSNPGTADPAGTAGTAGGLRPIPTTSAYGWRGRRCGAALEPARGGNAAYTSRTPGTDAKRSVRPPRAAHYVRKRF